MAGPEATAGEMLAEVVGDLVARIGAKTPAALADEPDAVHQLRTTVRRLRNVLAAFSPYVEPTAIGGLRARLAEYGDRLGLPRDLEVRAAWCARIAAEIGLPGDLRDDLVAPLLAEHARAHAALVAWAASPDAEPLSTALGAAAAAPALTDGSARPAPVVAREVLLAQAARVIDQTTDYRRDPEAAHALRRAGRRLRHVGDAVTKPPAAVLGPEAAALGELGSRVQSLLGDHRDALLLADHLRGSRPDQAGVRAAYASMVEAAERAAGTALASVPAVLEQLEALVGRAPTTVPP
ncbi:CHAD domain-containing protein [Nocardioides bizhenqiangii]|uniref:CHAD domain-containing protein n=1 Tax=Nocardioides bizhenqiangii TaxID=3095076 RepID=A0ABZ0ZWA1_9ACTN|nr:MULTISPECIES: CHAD domain-containing protein [unclassified Nocardioides]MDZ5622964.1 CHAD domain-containing protein [Nocardioides sp. HM23]WQQ27947.1 CHAD domain-containing protein [Nocardioides sp. HM61]